MIFILLPAYNESKNLKIIFKKIKKYFRNKSELKVILVDDCSKDNTKDLIKKDHGFKIVYLKHKNNMGLSITMETGLKKIKKIAKKNDYVITLDSDNTHPISLMPKMIKKLNEGNDIVIASRFVQGSKVNGLVYWRSLMSIWAKYIFKIMYPFKNLSDYTCNYRAYRFDCLSKIFKNKKFFKNEDFNIAAKILLFLIKNKKNLKLVELPFTLSYDYKIGQSKMNILKTIFLTLRLIFLKKFS
jgi:dolichol-phosphate mannosyltransferase